MLLKDIEFINPENADVFFMTVSDYKPYPFCYCCNVKELYNDWMDEANNCPENDAMLLQVVFYMQNNDIKSAGAGTWEKVDYTKALPITNIGLNTDITFEDLMIQIEKLIRKNKTKE